MENFSQTPNSASPEGLEEEEEVPTFTLDAFGVCASGRGFNASALDRKQAQDARPSPKQT